MRQLSSNIFTGVMDQDSDDHLISRDDYRYALNINNGYGATPGAVENLRGTTSVAFTLPSGTNTVIGAVENKQRTQLIYFVHNSNGNHRILRYTPSSNSVDVIAKGSALNFALSNKIHSAAIVDGRLLYWVDGYAAVGGTITGNRPRKINLDKATKSASKKATYEIYAGLPGEGQFNNGRQYTFRIVREVNGAYTNLAGPFVITSNGTYANDPAGGLRWLAEQLNAAVNTVTTRISIETCDCKVTLTMNDANEELTMLASADPDDVLLVCTSNYPINVEEHHIDLAKRPPICPPKVNYISDPDVGYNNVKDLCAQFRVRYIYDDGEKSAWGPISEVALNTDVDGNIIEGMNAIQVDFTEAILVNPSWLTMIREVEVAWRNGNDGEFFLVKRIPVCELGIAEQKINFYNDQLYLTIESDDDTSADVQVLKNYDPVPLISGGVEVSSDEEGNSFLLLSSNLEGYDCPDCIDMEIDSQDFTDDCLITITGTVDVVNLASYPDDNPDFNFPNSQGQYGDYIVVYLAGTDYYGLADVKSDGTGTGAFEIKNVPRGTYLLRVASPLCRFDNLNGTRHNLNNGREYQRTSAPMLDVAGSVAAESKRYERYLDITGATLTFDLDTELGYGPLQIQNMHCARWQYGPDAGASIVKYIGVYQVDKLGLNANDEDRRGAINVELQAIVYQDNGGNEQTMYGDHNGYAWAIEGDIASLNNQVFKTTGDISSYKIYQGPVTMGSNALLGLDTDGELQELPPGLTPLPVFSAMGELLLINTSETWSEEHRSQIRFEITDGNNDPLPSALCMVPGTTGARFERTGNQGVAIITIYSDTGVTTRTVQPLVTYPPDYCYDYPFSQPGLEEYELNLDPDDGYTETVTIPVPGGVVSAFSFLKRGGMYRFGVVYMDDRNRTCGVAFGTEYRVPFPTSSERFLPRTLKWTLKSRPPIWATHFRIVRTREAYYQRYIQWLPDLVQYVRITNVKEAPINTTYEASDATHILIKVNAPLDAGQNVDAVMFFQRNSEQSGYEPMDGDRLRIVTTEQGYGVTDDGDIIELPIVGRYVVGLDYYAVVEATEIGFELKPGFLVEFVTPNAVKPEVYFEIGPCYDVLNPGTSNRAHEGDIQDQIWAVFPTPTTDAQGTVGAGDTYWRYETWSQVGSSGKRAYTEHNTIAANRRNACSDIGRPFVENKDFGQEWFYSRIRFSNIYLPGTKINGLSSFNSLDFRDVNRAWGAIRKIAFVHNVLLAFCQFKLQPVYIGKARLLDMSGNYNVGRSDAVLNIADETVVDAGCENPESVVVQDGYAYWWDVYNGVPWRYARNGVNPINTKMVKYFRQAGRDRVNLLTTASPCVAVFDRQFGRYILALGGVGEVDTLTIGFDELKNGWTSFFSFEPEWYGIVGQTLVSFRSGALWVHYGNGTRNLFYGTQYQSQIRFVSNGEPRMMKMFWSTRVVANRQWYYPTIAIPAAFPDYRDGMLSRLRAERWESYEGAWNADFMRDMYDPAAEFVAINASIANATRQKAALLRGRNLRGETMTITMETVDGSLAHLLLSADVYYSPSFSTHP